MPHGVLNVDAVAQGMGVSKRTVQRWLQASSGRAVARIPQRRLEQLITLMLPEADTLRGEEKAAAYARRAIEQLSLPRGMGVLASWSKQRWIEPHMVAVLAVRSAGIRQLSVTRVSGAAGGQMARRGDIVDFVVVPSRFHATVLVHETLSTVGPWRFAPNPSDVVQGRTQSWLDDAPAVDLGSIAAAHGLR